MVREPFKATGATGHELPLQGRARVNIRIGDTTCTYEPWITQNPLNLMVDGIIGWDLMVALRMDILVGEKAVKIGGKKNPFSVQQWRNCKLLTKMAVRSVRNITIPPRCEMIVTALVELPVGGNSQEAIVEPVGAKPGIALARALVTLNSRNQVPVRIMNCSEQPVNIDNKQVIAKATWYDPPRKDFLRSTETRPTIDWANYDLDYLEEGKREKVRNLLIKNKEVFF